MTEDHDELRAAVEREISYARSWEGDVDYNEQSKALSYYFGRPMGDEVHGRSQLVSWDVFEVVETATPELLEPFFSEERLAEFEADKEADVQFAKDATEYVNAKLIKSNNAFETLCGAVKDGLLLRLGILRAWRDESRVYQRRTYKNMPIEGVAMLLQSEQDRVADQEKTGKTIVMPGLDGLPIEVETYDVTIIHDRGPRGFRYDNVAPETFVYSRSARKLEDATLIGEQRCFIASELVAMGYDKTRVEELTDFNFALLNESVEQERSQTSYLGKDDGKDATRKIDLFYGFIRLDVNGDGVAEWRRVLMGGNDTLMNDEVDDHEYCVWTPVLVPHRVAGLGFADAVIPLQEMNTMLQRQYIDSLFLANNPRTFAAEGVDLSDLQDNAIGGIVRMRQPGLAGPLQTAVVAGESLQGLEWGKSLRENRVGMLRNGPGLDKDSLNPRTATEVNKIESSQQRRMKTVLRMFAEQLLKRLVKLALRDCVAHADDYDHVMIKGKQKQFAPSQWNPEMSVRISVGLGTGDKSETMQGLQLLGQFMQMVAAQGLPIVQPENIYNFGVELAKNANLRGIQDRLLTDPKNIPPQPPKPSPEEMKMRGQMEIEKMRIQSKAQADISAKQAETQIDVQRFHAEKAIEITEAEKQRRHEFELKRLEINANQEKELLALASGIIAAKTGVQGQNLINGTQTDQSAQAPGITPVNLASIIQGIRDAAAGLQGGMQISDVENAIFSTLAPKTEQTDTSLEVADAMRQLAAAMNAPEEIVRDENGKAIGKRKVSQ